MLSHEVTIGIEASGHVLSEMLKLTPRRNIHRNLIGVELGNSTRRRELDRLYVTIIAKTVFSSKASMKIQIRATFGRDIIGLLIQSRAFRYRGYGFHQRCSPYRKAVILRIILCTFVHSPKRKLQGE